MSRAERLKMKKEAWEKQKEKLKKKKRQVNTANSEGDWNVEHITPSNNNQVLDSLDNELDISYNNGSSDIEGSSVDLDEQIGPENKSDKSQIKGSSKIQIKRQVDKDKHTESDGSNSECNSDNDILQQENKFELKIGKANKNEEGNTVATIQKSEKKKKDSKKNKNFNEKILNRNFKNKKDLDDTSQKEVKIVDPFFITSTGENYMSLAEPRAPDEVKEFHKEGNRKLRRAVKFGLVPKIKPRQEFRQDNKDRFNRHNRQNGFDKKSGGFDRQNLLNDRFNRKDNFKDNDRRLNENQNYQINKFRDNPRTNFNDQSDASNKPEKLHPSWEAKKRQSGILPFKGKKVVFDDD